MAEQREQLDASEKVLRSTVLLVCLATFLFTGLQILGRGYHPTDDALRHVAKVISGKPWQEILVVRDEIGMDSHPGWHAVLHAVGSWTRLETTLLLNFSVLSLLLLFCCFPLFYFERCEAWVASLLALAVVSFGPIYRLTYGRPFIVSMFLLVFFCFVWERIRQRRRPAAELVGLALAASLSTWVHGAWYLLPLPLCALGLAREWRPLLLMSLATAAGVLLGALFTGTPVTFLHQMLFHARLAFGRHDFQRQLVSEFQPYEGASGVLILVALALLWRAVRGQWTARCVDDPVFILAGLGWVLGFVAVRFWTDWGWPAIAYWLAREIDAVLRAYTRQFHPRRLILVAGVCLAFFLAISNDHGNRWTGMLGARWPQMENPEHRSWLPDPGGILYSDHMGVFYNLFSANPHGDWKYVLGFEPVWMPDEDLAIYRKTQLAMGDPKSYAPWVAKMTAKDRMVLLRQSQPQIAGLEWHEVTPGVWSGKLAAVPVE